MKEALVKWLQFVKKTPAHSPPDWEKTEKGHGRVEERRLWIAPCEEDMQAYLAREFDCPRARWCGWIARRRRFLWASAWEEPQEHLWLAGGAFPKPLTAA